MLRKLKLGRDNRIDALSRYTDKPIMEYCEYKNGAIIYNRAFQGHSHGVVIKPTLFSLKPELTRKRI